MILDSKGLRSDKNCILFIDDDYMNREIQKQIFSAQYDFIEASNGLEGLKKLEEHKDSICAILLDVSMPIMDGMEFLRIIHSRGITKVVPVFMITVSTEFEIIQEGYELGVMDVITKPATPFVILRRVQNIIELFRARETLSNTVIGQAQKIQENADNMDSLHRNTIEALASAIEFRDVESGEHTNRIYNLTKYILLKTDFGKGLTEDEVEDMAVAAIMHDVGKIAISDIILNKPGKLTADEFEIMKTHAAKGELLIEQIARIQSHNSYKYARDIARHHHERWDGKGYPDGLKGDEISVCAQVVSIADVYDALLSPRVYKKAYEPDKALRMILDGECGTFNPKLIESFVQVEPEIRKWYTGGNVLTEKEIKLRETKKNSIGNEKTVEATFNRDIVDVLLLMAAVQSAYDMIICANLTKNTYYMIDYDRFLTHTAGYDGKFDDLIEAGASAVPESHREEFVKSFCRENLVKAYKKGKKTVHLEHPQYSDDGVKHMVSTTVLFVDDPKTDDIIEITLACYVDEEWAERERHKQILSDALAVAEKANAAKSDFLSRMSHDIRTPLNAIMGMTTIIGANISDQVKIKECIHKIGVASKHLLELINNILDFSQIESGNMSINENNFDIYNMVEDVKTIVEERANAKNQAFSIYVDEAVHRLYRGDEFRIRQILINLLDNACKYTPDGGEYSLRVSLGKSTSTHHYLSFEVKDNGVGISENHFGTMFNPFVQCGDTTDNKGVGLGLSITRNLVYLMNGKMDVESKLGEGTRFIVELPVQISTSVTGNEDDAEKQLDISPDYREIMYNGQKILVAEDNELNQEIIKTILEMKNLNVDIVSNGKEAVDKFIASEPGEYTVIFMDISMPVMNGYEASIEIRKSDHKEAITIPIYALTANAFYNDVVEAKNNGMNGHISKPIDFNDVSKILSDVINQ